jgi:hypothetical protein
VLPTCGVALWAASRNSAGHVAACQAALGDLFGWKATLGGVEYPEPRLVRYLDVHFADPETGEAIATASVLQVQSNDDAILVSAAELTLAAGADRRIAEVFERWLQMRSSDHATPLRFHIEELHLPHSNGDVSLLNAGIRIERTSEGRAAQLAFRTSEMPADGPSAVFTIVRGYDSITRFQLETQGAFERADAEGRALMQFLRTLVTGNQALVPMSEEAQALLQVSPQHSMRR